MVRHDPNAVSRPTVRCSLDPVRPMGETDRSPGKRIETPEDRTQGSWCFVCAGDCLRSQSAYRRGGALLDVGDLARLTS
jgi:hypothetical protein